MGLDLDLGLPATLVWPQEAALVAALRDAPAQHPGCSGTRLLQDNLSDLHAQIAANQKGIQLVGELIDQYGLDVVQVEICYRGFGFVSSLLRRLNC